MKRLAIFSDDRKYRYSLSITWDDVAQPLVVIGLNPSTADEYKNDPTVTRCERRARERGHGGLVMLNLFAFRSTDPKEMLAELDPVGEDNDYWIGRQACRQNLTILCAWGKHGNHRGRADDVMDRLFLENTFSLGLNKNGTPKHPLYIPYNKDLEAYG